METIIPLLKATRTSSHSLLRLTDQQRQEIVKDFASALEKNISAILDSNQIDLDKMTDDNPKKDRLMLNEERILSIAAACRDVAGLADPVGKVQIDTKTDNGLHIQRIAVPMGVIGMIYEARPNVTIDVAALCIRSGNAVVLRGGSDAEESNKSIVKVLHTVLDNHNLSTDLIQLIPVDRAHVKTLLEAREYVDIIIPRGSRGLIDFVRENSKVPTIETGAGVCHTYVHSSADLDMAADIVVNAKTSRPSVCNCLDTIIVDAAITNEFLPKIKEGLEAFQVEIFADERAYPTLESCSYNALTKAKPEDFGREFLDYKCSVKVVQNIDEALEHIRSHSSAHSEAIIATDTDAQERFLVEVDAAAVYTNASTRFTDGGEFGLGAEIGISTQKLHARGPFALEKLMTEKWVVRGNGQIR